MTYRFNNGRGGVTCDQCRKLIDQDLSFKEYEETYAKSGEDGDFCMACKMGLDMIKKDVKMVNKNRRNTMARDGVERGPETSEPVVTQYATPADIRKLQEQIDALTKAVALQSESYNRHIADLHVRRIG